MSSDRTINFSIIAHIDHGKSTLADKIISLSGNDTSIIDNLELEKERGITIKSKTVRVYYNHNSYSYQLNMIDTPGHSDFSYEVSKSLYACDYTFLLIDASKGVQAQTISNAYKAIEQGVTIVPVINKIDMPTAKVPSVVEELKRVFGFKESEIHFISAKTGEGVERLLQRLIKLYNSDKDSNKNKQLSENGLRALIFDSFFDTYTGVNAFVLVQGGEFKIGDKVVTNNTDVGFEIRDLGYYGPKRTSVNHLKSGEVGYITTGLKDISQIKVGDTLYKSGTDFKPFPGFKEVKPLVFLGVFTKDTGQNETLRKGLEVLNLSDSSFSYQPETLGDLGFGFKCGFLGLLHADIVIERIKREYDIDLVITSPSVPIKVFLTSGDILEVSSAKDLPDSESIDYIEEPYIDMGLLFPKSAMGSVMELVKSSRGEIIKMESIGGFGDMLSAKVYVPLSEVVVDFNDNLKSITKGLGSFEYTFLEFRRSDIVKLDILVGGKIYSPLSVLIHRSKSVSRGRDLTKKLKQELPRQQVNIPIQASLNGKIVARETLQAYRKDVTAKLYGGDRTRKDKLLKKQKKGKKRMQERSSVDINKDTFLKVIKSYG